MSGRSPSGRAGGPTDLSPASGSQPKALIPSAVDITEAERGAVIDWLHRRARLCMDARQWWRPFRARRLRGLAGAFKAAALSIKERAHLAQTPEAEMAAFQRARNTAKGIEAAAADETPQAAQPEGQEPGAAGIRPDSSSDLFIEGRTA
jgi:hypothetical protein